jgi:hypothetical protein
LPIRSKRGRCISGELGESQGGSCGAFEILYGGKVFERGPKEIVRFGMIAKPLLPDTSIGIVDQLIKALASLVEVVSRVQPRGL